MLGRQNTQSRKQYPDANAVGKAATSANGAPPYQTGATPRLPIANAIRGLKARSIIARMPWADWTGFQPSNRRAPGVPQGVAMGWYNGAPMALNIQNCLLLPHVPLLAPWRL